MMLLPSPIVHHPFAYTWGRLGFTGFGIAVLLAFLVGQVVAQRELARRGIDPEPVNDMVFAAVIGGLLGAKLYYVVVLGHWDAMFERGGFVYWGGLLGGTLAVMAVVVKKRFGLWRMFDVGGMACAAAYAVGRTGCWAVGDDYGRPWTSRFAVSFPEGAPPSTVANLSTQFGVKGLEGRPLGDVLSVYPTQLFEVTMGLVMFAVLWRLRDHKHAEGWLFGLYCVLAGTERFVVEFFRAKDDRIFGTFSVAQMFAVAFVVAGFVWMQMRREIRLGAPGIHAGR